jgi:multimeric flavodoxin WrbA
MNILAINGSPNRSGNTARLMRAILDGAESNDHTTETIHLHELNMRGCSACMACKREKGIGHCAQRDDFQTIEPKLRQADCLIIGSPIYFGFLTGQIKCLIDRWYSFLDTEYNNDVLKNKRFIPVIVSGAPAEQFCVPALDYLRRWLVNFLGMKEDGHIAAGGLRVPSDSKDSSLLQKAAEIGRNLQ